MGCVEALRLKSRLSRRYGRDNTVWERRNESGKVALSYETLPQQGHRIVSFWLGIVCSEEKAKLEMEDNSDLRVQNS